MPDQAPFVYVHRRGSVEIPRRACQVSAKGLQRSGSSRRESRAAAAYRSSGGESNAVDSISRGGRNMSSGDPEAPQRAIDKKKKLSIHFIYARYESEVLGGCLRSNQVPVQRYRLIVLWLRRWLSLLGQTRAN